MDPVNIQLRKSKYIWLLTSRTKGGFMYVCRYSAYSESKFYVVYYASFVALKTIASKLIMMNELRKYRLFLEPI